jgi:hypothetical protein
MIRIDRVAQAEAVSYQSGAQQDGLFPKQKNRPQPRRDVGDDKHTIDGNRAPAKVGRPAAKQTPEQFDH